VDLASSAQCREEERGKGVSVSICVSLWMYSELEGVLGCVTLVVPVNLCVIPPLCPAGLVLVLKHHNGAAHKLVCYFTNWAFSRPRPASILPRDLDPFLHTHLAFAFASMNNNQIDEKILYPELNKLKERNRELKTLLSIGGWNFGTSRFTTMLSTFANRQNFVNSVIALLRTHGFDGLDLFFLYPGLRGSPRHDRWTFVFLLEVLDKELPSKGPMAALSPCHIRALAQPSSLSDAFSVQLLDSLRCHSILATKCSLCLQVDFLKENNFGEAVIWAIDLDDFLGSFCNKGKYSLTIKLKSLLSLSSRASLLSSPHCSKDDVGQAARMATAEGQECMEVATEHHYRWRQLTRDTGSEGFCANISGDSGSGGDSGGDGGSCGGDGDGGSGGDEGFCTGKADGIYSNPKDTTKFHQCVGGKTFHFQCAQGLVFHQNCKCCNWPSI
ncbi:hypothetical protein EI555_012002, partial [Monodon monoceros]